MILLCPVSCYAECHSYHSLVVTLRRYRLDQIYSAIYSAKHTTFDVLGYLLCTISDHIPRKRYHQHNEMKSANFGFCQNFLILIEICQFY